MPTVVSAMMHLPYNIHKQGGDTKPIIGLPLPNNSHKSIQDIDQFEFTSLSICPGPMPNSISDFWRMIWEKRLPNIVMLTKCMEAGRVSIYDLTLHPVYM